MTHVHHLVHYCLVLTKREAVEFCEIVKAYHCLCDHEDIVHRLNNLQLSTLLIHILGVDGTGKWRGVRLNGVFPLYVYG